MDSRQMVCDLIAGSDNINRMRNEIKFVVGTVLSFVTFDTLARWEARGRYEVDKRRHPPSVHYEESGSKWEFAPQRSLNNLVSIHVRCHLKSSDGLWRIVYGTAEQYSLSSTDVKRVHESLHVFMRGVMEEFPELKDRLQYVWDAAVHSLNTSGVEYEVVFKKSLGFHAETFGASSDAQARLFVKAFQERGEREGENFYYPISLKKTVPLRP